MLGCCWSWNYFIKLGETKRWIDILFASNSATRLWYDGHGKDDVSDVWREKIGDEKPVHVKGFWYHHEKRTRINTLCIVLMMLSDWNGCLKESEFIEGCWEVLGAGVGILPVLYYELLKILICDDHKFMGQQYCTFDFNWPPPNWGRLSRDCALRISFFSFRLVLWLKWRTRRKSHRWEGSHCNQTT